MMLSKGYNFLFFLFLSNLYCQTIIKGVVIIDDVYNENTEINIYEKSRGIISTAVPNIPFEIEVFKDKIELIFIAEGYPIVRKTIDFFRDGKFYITVQLKAEELSEVVISSRKKEIFLLKKMNDFEKTEIYAGKKSEVILVEQSMANLASNNSRQIYNQIPGLNIYQNDDAGLQLNIGGRGLDPNRTSNFNTRQNGYDISADVLGYPESYYTPPSEGLEEIQIIRGAASLQYGTQFGGLINFKLKKPDPYKPFSFLTRNTIGSNQLLTNFTMASGTIKKFKYLGFFNGKKGNGFRPNSKFKSSNFFFQAGYDFSKKTSLKGEITYLNYLAQQAGGLSDDMFQQNPFQSNRARNWFNLDWLLYNLSFEHSFNKESNLSINLFGLDAERNSIGFRSNRVSQIDPNEERDLIKGDFKNFGAEIRWLKGYFIKDRKSVFLVGGKYYKSNNTSTQGPGSENIDADFNFYLNEYPNYNQQSNYKYPNENIAIFSENIFYMTPKLSFTPGIRFEYIETSSFGEYKRINTDAAGNVILNRVFPSSEIRKRQFALLGLGLGYNASDKIEFYGNISQNYRSVTFADISIINPAFIINPNITDERGFTTDVGMRGKNLKLFSFDINIFRINYNNRIGFLQKKFSDGSVKTERGNVGDAVIYGFESLADFNIVEALKIDKKNYSFNYFINLSLIDSEYVSSETPGIEGKKVEFVPKTNFKTGLRAGYKNFSLNAQYSFLSDQFSDSTNAINGNLSGVIGLIPSYEIIDISAFYKKGIFKFELGINNLLDEKYFTRRATGYPGPGIIPSPNRNLYITTQIKF